MNRRMNPLYLLLAAVCVLAFSSACSEDTSSAPEDVAQESDTVEDTATPEDIIPDLTEDTTGEVDAEVCIPDCAEKACGDDGCGGTCGECDGCDGPNSALCEDGQCATPCCPDCEGKSCGDDGCGNSCGACGEEEICSEDTWECTPSCVPDCEGKDCGSDGCEGSCGECPDNASCSKSNICTCTPQCGDKVCGDDGCGGSCGDCGEGQICAGDGLCVCAPQCEGKVCGDDGCGGNCGECADNEACSDEGLCTCVPQCNGKDCGDDGCESSCGDCGAGDACSSDGLCECVPQCENKECGEDACGETCGDCAENAYCDVDFTCVCVPNCDGKQCGNDGCGGICGICPAGVPCEGDGVCAGTQPILTCTEALECLSQAGDSCEGDATICAMDCLDDSICASGCFATTEVDGELNALNTCIAESCPEGNLACLANACPEATGACLTCDPTTLTDFGPLVVVTSLAVGDGGQPGEALNIDPDNGPDDCSPNSNCTDGLDNQLTSLGGLGINEALDASMAEQSLVLIAEIPENTDEPFDLYLYSGSANDLGCDPTISTCDFWIASDAFTPLCSPVVVLYDAVFDGDQLTAGGDDSVIILPLALADDATLYLTLYRARLEATVTQDDNGYSLPEAVLGGAVRKNELLDAIDAYPGDSIAGIGKGTVSLLLGFISSDVDTDGNGSNDALSVGLKATGMPANVLGVQ